MLRAEHITKNYGAFRALDDVSVEVKKGRIFGLLGPNGAGKTTLIRIINHISRPDTGSLWLDGCAMTDADTLKIGYMPEERGLYKKMKVGEQAVYLARLKGLSRHDAEVRLRQWFKRFEIEGWWSRRVEELSKGMQQKLQFIVTVVHEPKLLVFDEPFSGFDPVNATLLKNEILRLRDQGSTVIFSTHNMSSVEEICDDIALINKSRVVLSGSVREIRESFRQNMFRLDLRSSDVDFESMRNLLQNSGMQVESGTLDSMVVRLPQTATSNDLLSLVMGHCQVAQLQEVLPSMNDIFISSVQNEKP